MGPQLLLDKSAIQSLSQDEAFQFGLYYDIVIPPVLMAGILADFAKAKKSKQAAKVKLRSDAMEIARKLCDCPSQYFSLSRRELVVGELLTGALELSHRPYVDGSRITTESGRRVFWVDDGPENALSDWAQEEFTPTDRLSAYDWRLAAARIDLEVSRKALIRQYGTKTLFRDFGQLAEWVDGRLSLPAVQASMLELLLGFSQAGPQHSARALLLFHFGLLNGLVGTWGTNRVDLEYLFYLPFCVTFCSGDEFHRMLAPLLLDAERSFVERDDLKGDLGQIAEARQAEPAGKRRRRYPPENPASVTWCLWQQHMAPEQDMEEDGEIRMSPEEREQFFKRVEDFQKVRPPGRRHEGTML